MQVLAYWPDVQIPLVPLPLNASLYLLHSSSSGGGASMPRFKLVNHSFFLLRELLLQSRQASSPRRLMQILAPSSSRENPWSGKEPPPPPLSSVSLDKQNTAHYSRHILPVAITSMGASAPRTVWCWVPPMGTGYRLPLPTMSVECKCLFKKLCSSIDFISFSLFLARLFLAQVKCLSITRFSRWSKACCLSHKSRYYSIK